MELHSLLLPGCSMLLAALWSLIVANPNYGGLFFFFFPQPNFSQELTQF